MMKKDLRAAMVIAGQVIASRIIGKNFQKTVLAAFLMLCSLGVWGQYSYTTLGSTYTQDFNNLSSTAAPSPPVTGGSLNNVNTTLNGWYFLEVGSSANTTYTATNGNATSGETFSLGTVSNSDRALGGLQSGSVNPTIGFYFTNNTGSTITSLEIAYTGEQWRLGVTGRNDKLDFQYSTDATSLSTGAWTDVNLLDFTAPISTGTAGALNGNLTANKILITNTITGLSIANGSKVFIRWNDSNATGADDALGVDDFSIKGTAAISAPEINIKGNSNDIADGSTTFATTNDTDFGTTSKIGTITKTFTIENTGNAVLNLTKPFTTTSSNGFTIDNTATSATVAAGGTTTFVVNFTNSTAGTYKQTINVESNDSDEATYNFDVQAVVAAPTLSVSTYTLSGFNYVVGAGPSSQQSFTVSGSYFAGDVTLTPPADYEISKTSGGSFAAASTITFTPAELASAPPVYVRLKAGLSVSATAYNGETIAVTSPSATTQNVTLNGTVDNADVLNWGHVYPATGSITDGASNSYFVHAEIYQPSLTPGAGQGGSPSSSPVVQFGYSTTNSDPSGSGWTWVSPNASYEGDDGSGQNDLYQQDIAAAAGLQKGVYFYSARVKLSGSSLYKYLGTSGFWGSTTDTGTFEIKGDYVDKGVLSMSPTSIVQGTNTTATVEIYEPGVTDSSGPNSSIVVQIGYSSTDSDPSSATGWTWVTPNATFASAGSNNYVYTANFGSTLSAGNYFVAVRTNKAGRTYYQYLDTTWDTWDNHNAPLTVIAPQEINIKQGATNIPSAGSYGFGNQSSGTSSSAIVFTIENTGQADLLLTGTPKIAISGTNAAEFTINETATTSPITGAGSTTFTVTFSPLSTSPKTAQLSIANNDTTGSENPYEINLTGTGTASAASNIITNSAFVYGPINYIPYVNTNITTANSFELGQFTIQDGGGSADADNLGTTLSALSLTVGNFANLERLAIYDGTTEVAEVNAAATTTFSGITGLVATDGGTKTFSIRGSFKAAVTDNQRITLTISSATAANTGSTFGTITATTSTAGTDNVIQVVADRLAFVTQPPASTNVNVAMATVTVSANDTNGNRDLDFTAAAGTVNITSTGTLSGTTVSVNAANGLATFTGNLTHTAQGTGFVLYANHTGLTQGTSSAFNIVLASSTTDYFRSIQSGNWATAATWESSADNITWKNPSTLAPTSAAASIEILSGHTVTTAATATANNLTVRNGGKLQLNSSITNAGTFTVEDNASVTINYGASTTSPLWNGVEIFHPDSNFIIKNWTNTTGNPLFNGTNISQNLFGTYSAAFGNLILDFTTNPGRDYDILDSGVTANLAHGNFIFRNSPTVLGTQRAVRISTTGSINSGIGGNLIIENTYNANDVITLKTSGTITFTVGKDIEMNAATFRPLAGSGTSVLNVLGKLNIAGGTFNFNSTNSATGFSTLNLAGNLATASSGYLISGNTTNKGIVNFIGTITQTIDVANQTTASNIVFNVNSGAYTKLINQNLSLGTSSTFNVLNGGTLDFGFDGIDGVGTNPLNIIRVSSQSGQIFNLNDGGTLKITSPLGITTFGDFTGNVQIGTTIAANRVFGTAGIYHYIGKVNQVSGNGLPSTAGDKKVIVELANDNLKFWATPESGVGSVKRFTSGGGLEIRKGIVYDGQNPDDLTEDYGRFADAVDTGASLAQSGNLTMTGGRYILYHSAVASPHLSGNYNLTGGVIQFDGNAQSIRALNSSSVSNEYLTVEVTGKNVGTPAGNITLKSISTPAIIEGSLTVKNGGEFLINSNSIVGESGDQTVAVESDGIFRTGDADGFSGSNQTSIQPSIENIDLQDGSTVEYSRANAQTITDFKPLAAGDSNLTTGGYYNLKISGDNGDLQTGSAKTISSTTPIYVRNNVDVETTARLIIDAGKALIVRNAVNNNSGAATGFIVESDGNLKQLENVTNTTAISVRRLLTLSGIGRKEYNFFSSPVADQNMKLIYGGAPANVPYVTVLNEATNLFVNAVTADWALKARGFAVKEPKTSYVDMPAQSLLENEVEYKGIPNNGDNISINLKRTSASKGYNVVGNPYPSNIDIVKLWKNSVTDWQNNPSPEISADFRFWDNKANSTYEQMGGSYQGYSYAIYNAKSQYSTAAPGLDPNNGGGGSGIIIPPSNIIKVSQGFMVRALKDNTPMNFNNAMREVAQGTNYYGKDASINRYRLQLRTSGDFVLQNAVTYIPVGNTSFGIEDTRIPNSSASDALFSYADDAKVVINGRSNFMIDDVVLLGLRHFTAGTYKIQAVDKEGVFANGQSIYLKDKELGIVADLTLGDYTFTSNSGEYTNRFEIVYKPGAVLATEGSTKSGIEVYRDAADFVVRSSEKTIDSIELYDASGKLVLTLKGNNGKDLRFSAERLVDGMYVLKAMMKDGEQLTKKIRK